MDLCVCALRKYAVLRPFFLCRAGYTSGHLEMSRPTHITYASLSINRTGKDIAIANRPPLKTRTNTYLECDCRDIRTQTKNRLSDWIDRADRKAHPDGLMHCEWHTVVVEFQSRIVSVARFEPGRNGIAHADQCFRLHRPVAWPHPLTAMVGVLCVDTQGQEQWMVLWFK